MLIETQLNADIVGVLDAEVHVYLVTQGVTRENLCCLGDCTHDIAVVTKMLQYYM